MWTELLTSVGSAIAGGGLYKLVEAWRHRRRDAAASGLAELKSVGEMVDYFSTKMAAAAQREEENQKLVRTFSARIQTLEDEKRGYVKLVEDYLARVAQICTTANGDTELARIAAQLRAAAASGQKGT